MNQTKTIVGFGYDPFVVDLANRPRSLVIDPGRNILIDEGPGEDRVNSVVFYPDKRPRIRIETGQEREWVDVFIDCNDVTIWLGQANPALHPNHWATTVNEFLSPTHTNQVPLAMIELEHVHKRYGAKTAVEDLNLSINRGELFAFLGPNGAGKTTTIKMMCGLLFPSSGTIRIAGFDLRTNGTQARQCISYVPDQPFLYEKLTGREVLNFIADMYGMSRVHKQRRIAEMIEQFSLADFVDDLTERYSHGMRQRTVFASALLHEPQVLIVDEPTVGLDPRSVRMLKDLLRREADNGMTVFLSTHSLDIAQELADSIGVVAQGKLISRGTLADLQGQASLDGSLEEVFLKLTEELTGPV